MKVCFALSWLVAIVSANILPESNQRFAPITLDELEQRIVGGDEAAPEQFPYQVGLALKVGDKTAWCGGSLISDQYVLTAAHCTEQAESVTVYLGAHNIKDLEEPGQIRIEVPKSNIIVHEKWSMLTLTNDISLIKLPSSVEFNEQIQPVNLPKRNAQYDVGTMVVASGWGKGSDNANSVSDVLRYVQVPVVSQTTCSLYYLFRIKSTHICAGKNGKSTCQGDSGGPLAYTAEDGSKTVIGLTSFGIAFGCEIGWPAVFTRVTSFLDWIEEHTGIGNN